MVRNLLAELYERFQAIQTIGSGIMGYLAMLQQGDFTGSEQSIVEKLRPSVETLAARLDELRDIAARLNADSILGAPARSVVVAILASEPRIRLSVQALAKRLASSVIGWPRSEWEETLRVMQDVIREISTIDEAFGSAGPSARAVG